MKKEPCEEYIDMTEPKEPISKMVYLEKGTFWQTIKNFINRKKEVLK